MAYADYEYYKNAYLGADIDEADFSRLALRASSYLDYYTNGKAAQNSGLEALKMACCALAEQYQAIDTARALAQKSLSYGLKTNGPEASSESVGSWSKSYKSGGESAAEAAASTERSKQELADTVRMYLAGTGLLYRGRCFTYQCSHTL